MMLLSLCLGVSGKILLPGAFPDGLRLAAAQLESITRTGHIVSAQPWWLSYCFMLCPMVGKDSLLVQEHLRTTCHSFLVLPSA